MWNKKLEIHLYLAIAHQWMTLLVEESRNFREILNMIHINDALVYEYLTDTACDQDLSMQALKVRNGMIFYVY